MASSDSAAIIQDAIDAFYDPNRRTVFLNNPSVKLRENVAEKSKPEVLEDGVPSYRVKKGKDYVKNFAEPARVVDDGHDSSGNGSSDGDSFDEEEHDDDESQPNHEHGATKTSRATKRGALMKAEEYFQKQLVQYETHDFVTIPLVNKLVTISQHQSKIVSVIGSNRVSIIQGNPGCGKSTQVPQMILSVAANARKPCRIVVTQPRRVAAKTLAKFVCKQRGWKLGDYVGYQVGLDKNNQGESTIILFATPGVILRKLKKGTGREFLRGVTHFILDEVHERSKDLDFLMMMLRSEMLRKATFKLVLMSATMDARIFQEYFQPLRVNGLEGMAEIPLLEIPHVSYQVAETWLDQMSMFGPLPRLDLDQPQFDQGVVQICKNLMLAIEDKEAGGHLDGNREAASRMVRKSATLVFLPGFQEIQQMREALEDVVIQKKWEIVMLHSRLMSSQEEIAFNDVQTGHRKIILATNIAESSLTFPDVQHVIDFGLTRRDFCDHSTNLSYLKLDWVSKSELHQRRGRAGRVRDGKVYHLIPEALFEVLPDYPVPDMERTPLPNLVALAKTLRFEGGVKEVFASCICPPNEEDIERGILALKEVGGLTLDKNGHLDARDGDLTLLGEMINTLPLDVHLTRLIVIGFCFGIVDDCIALAAILCNPDLFQHSFRKECQVHYTRLYWSWGSGSDCIGLLKVYQAWKREPDSAKARFCASNFVDKKLMNEVQLREQELRDILTRASFILPEGLTPTVPPAEAVVLLKVTIAAAFYPNYLIAEGSNEEDGYLELMDHDPKYSLVFRGMPENPESYADQIARCLSDVSDQMKLGFYGSKCIAEFLPSGLEAITQPGMRDLLESREKKTYREFAGAYAGVQMAMRQRKASRKGLHLSVSKKTPMLKISKKGEESDDVTIEPLDLVVGMEAVPVEVTHVSPTGRFWVRLKPSTRNCESIVDGITRALNSPGSVSMFEPLQDSDAKHGVFVVAFSTGLPEEKKHQRGKIVHVDPGRAMCVVQFVDYGFSEYVPASNLWKYHGKLFGPECAYPPQALPCELAEIMPHPYAGREGAFSHEAIKEIRRFVDVGRDDELTIKFYSSVHGVARVYLKRHLACGIAESLNSQLCSKGLAAVTEESWLSVKNREKWLGRIERSPRSGKAPLNPEELFGESSKELSLWLEYGRCQNGQRFFKDTMLHKIRGPYSPLEVRFSALCLGLKWKTTRVHLDSVNTAAVDVSTGIRRSKLLVAERLTLDSRGDSVLGYRTSLMSLSPGQVTLLCMIFSPYVEFRRRWHSGKIDGLLCGLGFTKESEGRITPIYPDHDMEVSNDVEIFESDIREANEIRHLINSLLRNVEREASMPRTYQRILEHQSKLRTRIQDFLCLQRLPRIREERDARTARSVVCSAVDGQWGLFGSGEVKNFSTVKTRSREKQCGRATMELSLPKLQVEDDRYHFLAEELTRIARVKIQLQKTDERLIFLIDHNCGLCGVENLQELSAWRNHLESAEHKRKQGAALAEAEALGIKVKHLLLSGRPFPTTQVRSSTTETVTGSTEAQNGYLKMPERSGRMPTSRNCGVSVPSSVPSIVSGSGSVHTGASSGMGGVSGQLGRGRGRGRGLVFIDDDLVRSHRRII